LKKWPGTAALYNSFAGNHSHADSEQKKDYIATSINMEINIQ